jgi:hypothetical protein
MNILYFIDELGGACSMHGIVEKYNIFVGKPEGRRPLGRPGRIGGG